MACVWAGQWAGDSCSMGGEFEPLRDTLWCTDINTLPLAHTAPDAAVSKPFKDTLWLRCFFLSMGSFLSIGIQALRHLSVWYL